MGSMAELLVCAGFMRPILRMGAALLLVLLWLCLTFLSFAQETALAHSEDSTRFTPFTQNLITITISSPGQVLTNIVCSDGYTATSYAEGFSSPRGLAFSPADVLYVSDSTLDQVVQVGTNGTITPVVTGVTNPEGLTFDDAGILYVVEDIKSGRLVSKKTDGFQINVTSDLASPEDVIWVDEGGPEGTLYVTESRLQHAFDTTSTIPSDYQTYLTVVSPVNGAKTRVLTTEAVIGATPVLLWSYSGVARGPAGLFYLTNEYSGRLINGNFGGTPYTAASEDAVFTVDLAVNPTTATAFAGDDDIKAPEGLAFSPGGTFPLYVAEESIGGGVGRLSRIDAAGNVTSFCTGFEELEDVALDQAGNIYVAEDQNGRVIRISDDPPPAPPPPDPDPDPEENLWLPVILTAS